MRVKIIPHGSLLETWPAEFECEARTPAQAINAISRNFDVAPKGKPFSQVRIVGIESQIALNSPCNMAEYHVVPDFSGGGGFIKIIIGAVLIAVGAVLDAYSFGVAGNPLIGLGASMVLGGIMDLISPHPKGPVAAVNSIYLGAPLNTTQIGTTIPIGYGGANVNAVAAAAGVSTKTLYRLIPTKADLFIRFVNDRINRFVNAFEPGSDEIQDNHNDWGAGAAFINPMFEINSIHAGHLNVRDDAVSFTPGV